MSEAPWEPVDLQLFTQCSSELQYDEMIFNPDFDSKKASDALDCCNPRIDPHLFAKGNESIKSLFESGYVLPDKELTVDEIISICGKFVDLQVSRLDGYSIWTTVLGSIYLDKEVRIQNPLLKLMFKIFSHAIFSMEKLIKRAAYFRNSSWMHVIKDLDKYVEDYNHDELVKEVEQFDMPEVLRSLAQFELAFASICESPNCLHLPTDVKFPETSSEIGFNPKIHYRDNSFSNPPSKFVTLTHDESIQKLYEFIQDVNNIPNVFPVMPLDKLFLTFADWVEAKNYLSFTRILLYAYIFPGAGKEETNIFINTDFVQYLKAELAPYCVPPKLFDSNPDLGKGIFNSMVQLCHFFTYPIPQIHSFLYQWGISQWGVIQQALLGAFQTACPKASLPHCTDDQHMRVLEMAVPFYTTRVACILSALIFRWGFKCEIYSPRDYYLEWHLLYQIQNTLLIAYSESRTLFAISETIDRMKHSKSRSRSVKAQDVIKHKQKETPEELMTTAMSCLFQGLFYVHCYLDKTEAIDWKPGNYFMARPLYKERRFPMRRVLHIATSKYHEISQEYARSADESKKRAQFFFKKGMDALKAYLKNIPQKSDDDNALFRCYVSTSLFLNKHQPGMKAKITMNHFFYPTFEVVNE